MKAVSGKYIGQKKGTAWVCLPLSFFLAEFFAFFFLSLNGDSFRGQQLWPLAFGALWALGLGALLRLFGWKIARVLYGITYFFSLIYAGFQTGYYILFSEMMWLTDFRYASEGSDYADVLLGYPVFWWIGLIALIALGILLLIRFPKWERSRKGSLTAGLTAVFMAAGALCLPQAVFRSDSGIRYAGSDYGRMQSAEAAYENLFSAHRLYQVCGLYQTFAKDVSAHVLYPLTPGYARQQEESRQVIQTTFESLAEPENNEMTGILAGKNVVLVLMESMDDWMITEDTPNLNRLMGEGINFTNFYTPVYGGIRTFNTEFCINTGSYLSSQGGYAFDYVTNTYRQSLASRLRESGYSAKTFHYNDPTFYSRGVFSQAMGYEEYVCYADYVPEGKEKKDLLYDDNLLFDNEGLNAEFFRPGPTLNFVITRSAHLSYKYNEVLSHWALKKYPDYRGFTGSEENDCALVKARLVDDFFGRLLAELEEKGQLRNTVIIGVTDHYTYGYKNEKELLELSGVEEKLLLEKTPCFIWSQDLEPMEMDKVLNTADLLPTVLNLLGQDMNAYSYLGRDAFDSRYEGWVPFSNGSWIMGNTAYDAAAQKYIALPEGHAPTISNEEIQTRVSRFIRTNNLILDTDYFK